jgi:hypothetical protein
MQYPTVDARVNALAKLRPAMANAAWGSAMTKPDTLHH